MDDFQHSPFGNMSDRDILIRLATQGETIQARLNEHGKRLKALEVVRNWGGGVGAGIALVWTVLKLHVSVKQQ